jgi:peptidyl-prolyl cis-trans isomerase D
MSVIGKIRENTRLLVVVVALGLLFFMAREFIGAGYFSRNRSPIVGSVAGKSITLRTLQSQVEQLQRNYMMNYGQAPFEEEIAYLREHAWKQLVTDIIYEKVCQSLDIRVSEEELVDMVQGEHIHPDLQAAFIDPATREFSKKDLLAALQNIAKLPPANQAHWYQYEKMLAQKRCQNKFEQLMEHSVFVTNLEAQQKWTLENTSLDMQYLYVPYKQVPEEGISITNAMLKDYLQQHPHEYQVEESKEIRYATFPIVPSEQDKTTFHQELNELKQEFTQTSEDKLFASTHTDANANLVTIQCVEKDLPSALLAHKGSLRKGMVVGPVAEGDKTYKLYKVTSLSPPNPKKYELTVIEKNLTPSDETKEEAFRKAEDFIKNVKNQAQFDTQAQQHAIQVADAQVGKEDTRIGKLHQVRELVRWIYNEGKVGKVSPVFTTENDYVVAVVVAHAKAGLARLQQVQEEIREKVLNEQKAKKIKAKLQPLSALPLAEATTQYGSEAQVATAQQVKFNHTYLAGIGAASKAIHQAFTVEAGKRSPIIAEQQGVVLLEVTQRQMPPLPDSWQDQQKKQVELEQRMVLFQLPKALEELAKVKDHRYKYY